jgi:hypothetical protein
MIVQAIAFNQFEAREMSQYHFRDALNLKNIFYSIIRILDVIP